MLAIARALMSRPQLLLCDEPSLGLAPLIVQELFGILARLNQEEGLAMLLVEQNANLAMDIADRAYLLETGTIVAIGRRRRRSATTTPSARPTWATRRRPWNASSSTSSTASRSGAIYALLALGLVIIYRGTGHLNFAQGEMAMFSAFLAWWLSRLGRAAVDRGRRRRCVIAFVLGGDRRAVHHPPDRRKQLASPSSSRRSACSSGSTRSRPFIWKVTIPEAFGSLFPNDPDDFIRIGGAEWRYENIGVLVVLLVIAGLLFLLFQRTKFGLAMRAVASNPESAPLVGIRTGQVLMVSWGLAAAVGAIGGALVGSLRATSTRR